MSRKTKTTTTTRTTRPSCFEAMEGRTMYSASPAVVGYVTDYGLGNNPAMIQALTNTNTATVKWDGLTQVNYFSVAANADGSLPATSEDGSSLSPGLTTVTTAAHANGVKVNLVIGGAGSNTDGLRAVVDDTTGRVQSAFATSLSNFAKANAVDGFDLDFEPDGMTQADITGFGTLIAKVKTALSATAGKSGSSLKLSAAVMPEQVWLAPDYATASYELDATTIANLDQINVMAYDLGNPGDGAPIATAEADMAAWVSSANAAKSKLVMGLPFYGRGTTLTAAQQPASNPWANATDANVGTPSYATLLANAPAGATIPTTGAANVTVTERIAGVCGGAAVAYHFDGQGTIAAKTAFAVGGGYAGVMAWDLAQDHFTAAGSYASDSLMSVINRTVNGTAATTPTPTPDPHPDPHPDPDPDADPQPDADSIPSPTATPTKLTGTTISSYRFDNMMPGTGGFISNVYDGSTATYFASSTATGWYGLQLATASNVTGMKFAPRPGYGYEMVGGTFQASNDPTFANGTVTLGTITAAPADNVLTSLTVDAATAAGSYAYVRYLAPAGSYGMAAEVQFVGTPSLSKTASPAYAATDRKTHTAAPIVTDTASAVVDSVR